MFYAHTCLISIKKIPNSKSTWISNKQTTRSYFYELWLSGHCQFSYLFVSFFWEFMWLFFVVGGVLKQFNLTTSYVNKTNLNGQSGKCILPFVSHMQRNCVKLNQNAEKIFRLHHCNSRFPNTSNDIPWYHALWSILDRDHPKQHLELTECDSLSLNFLPLRSTTKLLFRIFVW